ncbi:MAG TPA: D-sedoheptulose 7-phosphate isomerase [Ignavibacteria bacterium]|nr:D-sedoheptulose 7-phosphate isomerase [Ignavibacteria bacterium]
MNKKEFIKKSFEDSSKIKIETLKHCSSDIEKVSEVLVSCVRSGGKMMLCGNGGSAADCQHIATEFVIRLSHNLERPAIPAIALTTDTSNLTAGGNDIGFVNVFARSVEALGRKGDCLIAISTSGNSVNIINAVNKAKAAGITTIGLLGCEGGKIKPLCDFNIVIPTNDTQRIQESHITVGHILCEIVERELYEK